jgi:hypothetical protein
MKKIILYSFVSFVAILAVVFMTSGFWLHLAVSAAIQGVTGFPVKIKKLDLDLAATRFGVYGVEINNPKTFSDKRFVSIPEVLVDFDLPQFLKSRKIYLEEIRLNIEEVSVVRAKSGGTNLSQLKAITQSKSEMASEEKKVTQASSPKALDFFVEKFILTVRRVRYHDEGQPLIGERVIDLNIQDETFSGISNFADIIRIIVLQITYKAALGNLGIPVDLLKGHLDSTLTRGQELATQSAELAQQLGTQAIEEGARALEQAAKKVPVSSPQIEKTMGEATQKAKGIFGSAEKFLKNTAESVNEKVKSASN